MKLPYLGARVRLGSRLGLGWGVGLGEGVGSARARVLAEAAARRPVRVVHGLSVPFSIYLYLSIDPIYLSAPAAHTGREQREVVSAVDEAWLDDAGILAELSHHGLLGGLLPLEVGPEEAGQPGREARCRVSREPSCASVGVRIAMHQPRDATTSEPTLT